MGNLIAFGFERSWAARESLTALRIGSAVEEAFLVERDPTGRCIIRCVSNRSAPRATDPSTESLWRVVAKFVYLNPGLDRAIPRGGSGLFLLISGGCERSVLREIRAYRPRILETSLSREAERKLVAELARAA